MSYPEDYVKWAATHAADVEVLFKEALKHTDDTADPETIVIYRKLEGGEYPKKCIDFCKFYGEFASTAIDTLRTVMISIPGGTDFGHARRLTDPTVSKFMKQINEIRRALTMVLFGLVKTAEKSSGGLGSLPHPNLYITNIMKSCLVYDQQNANSFLTGKDAFKPGLMWIDFEDLAKLQENIAKRQKEVGECVDDACLPLPPSHDLVELVNNHTSHTINKCYTKLMRVYPYVDGSLLSMKVPVVKEYPGLQAEAEYFLSDRISQPKQTS